MSNDIPKQRQARAADPLDHTTATLLLTMADTTWRMVVPTAILATLAVMADLRWHTKPWLTLASLPVGLGLSVLLVRRQLKVGA
jgi:F0F1-type ATP synthase assembly protein I